MYQTPGTPLRSLPTAELLRRAVDQAQTLVVAEVAYAREELREEIRSARAAGALSVVALCVGICAITLLLAAAAIALPGGTLVLVWFALPLLVLSGVLGWRGARRLPRQLLGSSRARLKDDAALARHELT